MISGAGEEGLGALEVRSSGETETSLSEAFLWHRQRLPGHRGSWACASGQEGAAWAPRKNM